MLDQQAFVSAEPGPLRYELLACERLVEEPVRSGEHAVDECRRDPVIAHVEEARVARGHTDAVGDGLACRAVG